MDISPTHVLINIIGGVALMIWSLKLVRLGVTRAFGANLHKALSFSTRNRLLAFVVGALVTALLQSSMATVLIVSSFAGQGLINTAAALALILGADVGTTIVAQLLAFDISILIPIFFIVGLFLFSSDKSGKAKNIGRILIGIGLILMSLRWISESAIPMKQSETLPAILKPLHDDMILAIIVAALITWIAHSSLAVVLLLMSLQTTGTLPADLALIMVLGVNLGGTIAPIVATLRDGRVAMRAPVVNMIMRLIGVAAFAPFIDIVHPWVEHLADDPARQVVNFHMIFNVAVALAFLPFTGILARFFTKIMPEKVNTDDPSRPKYLNPHELDTPAIALASASRETLRMAEYVQEMLEDTIKCFKTNDESLVQKIRDKDNVVDRLYEALKHYMAKLSQEYMNDSDAARFVHILTFATNIEHSGDVIDKNLMPLALKKIRNQRSFSQEGFREIENIHNAVLDSIRLAQSVLVSGDVALAQRMLEGKENIRRAEIEASASHIDRLREGRPETIATSSLHLDIIRDYRRINSYICTVAYPILEEKGHLPPPGARYGTTVPSGG